MVRKVYIAKNTDRTRRLSDFFLLQKMVPKVLPKTSFFAPDLPKIPTDQGVYRSFFFQKMVPKVLPEIPTEQGVYRISLALENGT